MKEVRRGRRQNDNFEALGFTLKRKVVNGKSKYAALCAFCSKEIANTCRKRLQSHRNVCVKKVTVYTDNSEDTSTDTEENCAVSQGLNSHVTMSPDLNSTNISEQKSTAEACTTYDIGESTSDNIKKVLATLHSSHNKKNIDIVLEDSEESTDNCQSNLSDGNDFMQLAQQSILGSSGNSTVSTTVSEKAKRKRKSIDSVDGICGKRKSISSDTNAFDFLFDPSCRREAEDKVINAIAKFFYGCNIPFSVIESDHFKNMIGSLHSYYALKIPGQKELSTNMLDKHYSDCISEAARHCQANSILLINRWKSASNSITVVTRFHNSNSNKHMFLHAKDFGSTSELEENLFEIIEESKLIARETYNTRVYAVVSDTASDMRRIGKSSNLWYSNCNSHIANLLVKDICSDIEVVRSCVEKLTTILKEFKCPALEEKCIEQGGFKVKSPDEASWCSYRDSLVSLKINLPFMRQTIANNKCDVTLELKKSLFDDDFEKDCQTCIELLDPVCEFVDAIQASDCNLSDIVDLWNKVYNNEIYQGYVKSLIEIRRSQSINIFALTAHYLNPRKNFDNLSEEERNAVGDFLLEELSQKGIIEWAQYKERTGIFQALFNEEITDSVIFWEKATFKAPELSHFALKCLQIPVSNIQTELFSNWSSIHSLTRNKLTSEGSKKLLYVYYSLKMKDQNKSDEY
ncbi:hypothetical protein NQ315_007150 [Exocentrus adspersus]|uniref:Transposase n=1 Tax=Exocentrus adspersus TaxID=1586481 RepID=A0AAV8WCM0_9CUCU|nr:hypothetical protein NQ315_007150 [Exocentrus adspersus]